MTDTAATTTDAAAANGASPDKPEHKPPTRLVLVRHGESVGNIAAWLTIQHHSAVDLFAFGQIRRDRCRKRAAGAMGVFGADAWRTKRGKVFPVVKEIQRRTFEMAALDNDSFRPHLDDLPRRFARIL